MSDNIILKIAGKRYICECGCNVFHHPTREALKKRGFAEVYTLKIENVYSCNGCGKSFETD